MGLIAMLPNYNPACRKSFSLWRPSRKLRQYAGASLTESSFFFNLFGRGTLFRSDPGLKGGSNLKALWRSHLISVRRPISYRM